MFLIDWVQNHIAQMILTGIIGIVVSRIALHGYRAKAALRIILATVQQFETEEKNLNAKGKGFLKPEHEKYLGMFVKALKNNVYRSSPISVDKTIAKEKKRLMNKGYITKGGNSTMKSILFIIALCLSLVVPCIADEVEAPKENSIIISKAINSLSDKLQPGFFVTLDAQRTDIDLDSLKYRTSFTTRLMEIKIADKVSADCIAGYAVENTGLLGLEFDLMKLEFLGTMFSKVPILSMLSEQLKEARPKIAPCYAYDFEDEKHGYGINLKINIKF